MDHYWSVAMEMVAKLVLKSGNLESGAENNISILLVPQNRQGYSAIMSPVMDVFLKGSGVIWIIVVAPKCTILGVLVRHNNVPIGQYKTHWIWLVAGIEWVTLGMNEGWRQKVRENECRNVWMQVIKQLKRMNGMSVLVNDIKMVGVQKMTFSDWN